MRALTLFTAAMAFAVALPAAHAASQKDWSDCRGRDADTALKGCTRVLQDKKLSPRERADAHHNRGLAYKAKEESERALREYDDAIRADPKWAVPYAKRGDLLDDMGERDRAIVDLSEAIRLDPRYDWAYAIRGYIYDRKGEYAKAIADYSESIRLDPKDAGTITNRGWTRRKSGNLDGAMTDFDEAIRQNPRLVRAYYNRGLGWSDRGDYTKAITDFNEAIRLDPKSDVAYHDRALARFYQGDFAAAATDISRSNEIKRESFTSLRLFLMRARAGGDGTTELAENARKLDRKGWPKPIIDFYLGRGSADEVKDAAGNAEQRCDAQFYLGQWYILKKQNAEAIEALKAATADDCPKHLFEYVGALVDLKRINP